MPAVRLSATLVVYRTPAPLLAKALSSLAAAIECARAAGHLSEAEVFVVDNGPAGEEGETRRCIAAWPETAAPITLVCGHGNVGYGRANNLVLPRLRSDLHLVMNPDVELAPDALRAALAAFEAHPDTGLLAPAVRGEAGEVQYLCRRYPTLWVLFLRGFAPAALRRRFAAALDHYEMRDALGAHFMRGVPLASGCFMLFRTALFAKVGGFDPRFFLYFEDYDLSLRMGREAPVAYAPDVRIVHHGGEAARKGPRHVGWFIASAWRFFSRHGWKIA
jgi:GT2 family glycosyltransferase